MAKTEIVVLANSVKHGQHCVAGKCITTGRWYRPVSNAQGAELSHDQAKYKNPFGTFGVKPLQRILMGFYQHAPLAHQPDNYLIDGNIWQQNYSINEADLVRYLDKPNDLWGDGHRVLHAQIAAGLHRISQSLYLVQAENLNLYHTDEGKRRASFIYNEVKYDFAVTDPNFDGIVKEKRDLNSILCISLGEEYHDYCYKLVATIF